MPLPKQPPPGINAPVNITQEDLSNAGLAADRNFFTRAGRALQKHLSRPRTFDWLILIQHLTGSTDVPTTSAEYNEIGQIILDHIISDPKAVWSIRKSFSTGASIEARLNNGLGARWDNMLPPFFRTFLD